MTRLRWFALGLGVALTWSLSAQQVVYPPNGSPGLVIPASSGGSGSGTVTSVATTSPITGGTFTTSGTIACATCAVTSGTLAQFAATTSAQFLGVISNETGSGLVMGNDTPTILTPIIASFVNATHTHLNAAGGGTLTAAAVAAPGSDTQFIYNSSNALAATSDFVRTGVAILTLNNSLTNDRSQIDLKDQTFESMSIRSSGTSGGFSQPRLMFADAEGAGTTYDAGISRCGIGCVEINSSAIGTFRDLKLRHLLGAGTAPSVGNTSANSCGTTAATIAGSDTAGRITVGATAGTSCTVTFGTAYATAPACNAMDETTLSTRPTAVATTTTVVIAGAFTAADVVSYTCLGY